MLDFAQVEVVQECYSRFRSHHCQPRHQPVKVGADDYWEDDHHLALGFEDVGPCERDVRPCND